MGDWHAVIFEVTGSIETFGFTREDLTTFLMEFVSGLESNCEPNSKHDGRTEEWIYGL